MYCKNCGAVIDDDCIICPKCGKQVGELKTSSTDRSIVINNNANASANASVNNSGNVGTKPKDKWVAFLLCLFLGCFGAHKFYEGKIALGILYLFTCGIFGIGWIVDCIVILCKPNPYYV